MEWVAAFFSLLGIAAYLVSSYRYDKRRGY